MENKYYYYLYLFPFHKYIINIYYFKINYFQLINTYDPKIIYMYFKLKNL